MGTNDALIQPAEGEPFQWFVVSDVTDYAPGAKYSSYIGGDNPFTTIQNPGIQDGSSCVVIKESLRQCLCSLAGGSLSERVRRGLPVLYRKSDPVCERASGGRCDFCQQCQRHYGKPGRHHAVPVSGGMKEQKKIQIKGTDFSEMGGLFFKNNIP